MDFFGSSKAKKDAKRSSSGNSFSFGISESGYSSFSSSSSPNRFNSAKQLYIREVAGDGFFGKKTVSKSNPASPPPHPAGGRSPPPSYLSHTKAETEYDFHISDAQTPYWKQPESERVPNSHPRPPLYGYGTPGRERRRDHGRERMDAMSYEPETDAPSSPFHPAGNRTPERPRKSTEYSREHEDRMYEADTRSNASPFHPFRSPSPSPYHTPDRRGDHNRDHYEAMYEADANTMLQNSAPASPFHPAGSRSPPPYRTPDRRSNHGKEQYEDMYEVDGDITPRNSSPPSPFHPHRTPDRGRKQQGKEHFEAMYEPDGNSAPPSPLHGPYYSSSDDDKHSNYLYPEIRTPIRSRNSTPVDHNKYQMVAVETYEEEKQLEPPELPDESQSFTMQEMAKMRGVNKYESGKEENESSEAYVSVAKYRVRQSVSETVEAIMDKHGDIAASSKLQSMTTRSYYLESLAAVVMELKSTVLRDLTKTRVAEMAAVVKDMESVKIEVTWLKTAVGELGEAVEYLGQYEAAKVEKEACEREAKAGKGEMEEMRAELERREKEMKECRERVTVVAGRIGRLEMKSWRLNKNLHLFHSKLHRFQGPAVLLHL